MSILFSCPHCGHQTNVADGHIGKSGPCAQCGKIVTVASPDPSPFQTTGFQSPPVEAPTPSPSQDLGDDVAMRMLLPVGRRPLAIIAGYLGLFSVLMFPAPIALVVGILAIRDIRRHPESHGMGRAIFGTVMGAIFTIPMALVGIAAITSMFG